MPPGASLPKSPAGGPSGPGASPALSPGGGAGQEAAAIADIKMAIPLLTKSINAFPVGDKRKQALLRAVQALESNFGKQEHDGLMPAAAQRITQAAKMGQGLSNHNMAPPGIMLGGPAPMTPPGGGPGM